MGERAVRFTEEFFDRLSLLLDEERGVVGTLSVTDFIVFELPAVRDRLAADYDGSTLATDDPDVRVLVSAGVLFAHVAVFATLTPEGRVEAFWLSLDR